MKDYLFQHSPTTILTQAVSPRPPQPGKLGDKDKERQFGGGEQRMYTWVGQCEDMDRGVGTWRRHMPSLGHGEQV